MFDYRIAYGCWLNDSREKPIVDEDWPSIRIDADTLSSLENTMAFLKMAGYNYLDVFGLITNHSWEDDISSTVSVPSTGSTSASTCTSAAGAEKA